MNKYYYSGPMQFHLMERDAYKAFRSHDKQKARCYNKNHNGYKNYGGRGIEVKYTAREFIGWWLLNIKDFKGKDPTVGRIDHDRNYSFDNIIIESRADNSKEVYYRTKNVPIKAKKVISYVGDKKDGEFQSTREASDYYGVCQQLVSMICRGKRGRTRNNILFKFEGE